jgi:SAM-dependent methyltransferase
LASDSAEPDFWETRYRQGVTPWDAGRVPPRLEGWLATLPARQRVLVPGCGSGYEVRRFVERGDDVVGIDFSDAALDAARRTLGRFAHHVRKADFFAFSAPPFDVVYERTFMCALPPHERQRWAQRVADVMRAGGLLAGFFFLANKDRGPPFGIAARDLHALLDPAFTLIEDEAVPAEQSVPVLAGHERWQVWKRRL